MKPCDHQLPIQATSYLSKAMCAIKSGVMYTKSRWTKGCNRPAWWLIIGGLGRCGGPLTLRFMWIDNATVAGCYHLWAHAEWKSHRVGEFVIKVAYNLRHMKSRKSHQVASRRSIGSLKLREGESAGPSSDFLILPYTAGRAWLDVFMHAHWEARHCGWEVVLSFPS